VRACDALAKTIDLSRTRCEDGQRSASPTTSRATRPSSPERTGPRRRSTSGGGAAAGSKVYLISEDEERELELNARALGSTSDLTDHRLHAHRAKLVEFIFSEKVLRMFDTLVQPKALARSEIDSILTKCIEFEKNTMEFRRLAHDILQLDPVMELQREFPDDDFVVNLDGSITAKQSVLSGDEGNTIESSEANRGHIPRDVQETGVRPPSQSPSRSPLPSPSRSPNPSPKSLRPHWSSRRQRSMHSEFNELAKETVNEIVRCINSWLSNDQASAAAATGGRRKRFQTWGHFQSDLLKHFQRRQESAEAAANQAHETYSHKLRELKVARAAKLEQMQINEYLRQEMERRRKIEEEQEARRRALLQSLPPYLIEASQAAAEMHNPSRLGTPPDVPIPSKSLSSKSTQIVNVSELKTNIRMPEPVPLEGAKISTATVAIPTTSQDRRRSASANVTQPCKLPQIPSPEELQRVVIILQQTCPKSVYAHLPYHVREAIVLSLWCTSCLQNAGERAVDESRAFSQLSKPSMPGIAAFEAAFSATTSTLQLRRGSTSNGAAASPAAQTNVSSRLFSTTPRQMHLPLKEQLQLTGSILLASHLADFAYLCRMNQQLATRSSMSRDSLTRGLSSPTPALKDAVSRGSMSVVREHRALRPSAQMEKLDLDRIPMATWEEQEGLEKASSASDGDEDSPRGSASSQSSEADTATVLANLFARNPRLAERGPQRRGSVALTSLVELEKLRAKQAQDAQSSGLLEHHQRLSALTVIPSEQVRSDPLDIPDMLERRRSLLAFATTPTIKEDDEVEAGERTVVPSEKREDTNSASSQPESRLSVNVVGGSRGSYSSRVGRSSQGGYASGSDSQGENAEDSEHQAKLSEIYHSTRKEMVHKILELQVTVRQIYFPTLRCYREIFEEKGYSLYTHTHLNDQASSSADKAPGGDAGETNGDPERTSGQDEDSDEDDDDDENDEDNSEKLVQDMFAPRPLESSKQTHKWLRGKKSGKTMGLIVTVYGSSYVPPGARKGHQEALFESKRVPFELWRQFDSPVLPLPQPLEEIYRTEAVPVPLPLLFDVPVDESATIDSELAVLRDPLRLEKLKTVFEYDFEEALQLPSGTFFGDTFLFVLSEIPSMRTFLRSGGAMHLARPIAFAVLDIRHLSGEQSNDESYDIPLSILTTPDMQRSMLPLTEKQIEARTYLARATLGRMLVTLTSRGILEDDAETAHD